MGNDEPTPEEMAAMETQKADLMMKAEALETATAGTLDTQEKLDAATAAHTALIASIAAATAVDTAMYQVQADAAEAKIEGAQGVVDGQAEVDRMATEAAETERMEKERADMNALAKALKTGIDINLTGGRVDSDNQGQARPYLTAANVLGINPTLGVTDSTLPEPVENRELKLDASTTVAALGGWQGAQYVKMDSDDKVTDTAVIYTNQSPPKRELFATKHGNGGIHGNTGIIGANGQVSSASIVSEVLNLMPMSEEFRTTPGIKNHQLAASVTERPAYIGIAGTLDGAPGEFRCGTTIGTDVCTSEGGTDGSTKLSAGWYFIPNDGAMASTPDSAYSAFGWWLNEDGDTKRADGFWFVSRPGSGTTASVDGTIIDTAAAITAVQNLRGTATYSGYAAGKVGLYNPLLNNQNVGGHFTADVTLEADFQGLTTSSSESWGTITGTIDGFVVNDRAMDDWEVKLLTSTQGGGVDSESNIEGFTAQPLAGVLFNGRTTWSIDGFMASDEMGTHHGMLVDAHEDSGLPLTTVGHFTAQYGGVGIMTGGFGATTTDPDE